MQGFGLPGYHRLNGAADFNALTYSRINRASASHHI
jgi:hypothetical protein